MDRRSFIQSAISTAIVGTLGTNTAFGKAKNWREMSSAERKIKAWQDEIARREGAKIRADDERPNILLILTDQQTINALSCAGNEWCNTPYIDVLAKKGVRFTTSYCASPVCGPSRSCLITGRATHETQVRYNGQTPDRTIPNFGEMLRKTGYYTFWSGKWHLPKSYVRGNDEIPGFINLSLPDDLRQVHLGYITDFIKAVDAEFFLRWEASRLPGPWCYTVSFHNPHDICKWTSHPVMEHANLDKYPPPPPNHAINPDEPAIISARRKNKSYGPELSRTIDWDEAHWRAYLQAYYHMVQHVDAAVGKVMRALEEGGWSENTLVIFSSDHGEGVAAHKWVTKLSLYEESTAVPFIMSFPGKIPPGRINNTRLVSGYDVMPTILDYAQVEEGANLQLRGYTLREAAEIPDKLSGPEYVVSELFTDPKNTLEEARMIRSKRYVYNVYSVGDNAEEFFDMQIDPGQTHNLVHDSTYAAELDKHRALLKGWISRTNDPFIMVNGE